METSAKDDSETVKVESDIERPNSLPINKQKKPVLNPGTGFSNKANKQRSDSRKFGRKRPQSFTIGNGKFHHSYKRRKKELIIPPTRFLLGGNICDPLNLNSLLDEDVNKAMNAVTPKSSPLPTPTRYKGRIETVRPLNIQDPLNLKSCVNDADYEQQLVSPVKKGRKKKKRKSSTKIETDISLLTAPAESEVKNEVTVTTDIKLETEEQPNAITVKTEEVQGTTTDPESQSKEKDKVQHKGPESESKETVRHKLDITDKIVSPVIPQPGEWKFGSRNRTSGSSSTNNWHNKHRKSKKNQQLPNFKEKNKKFQYGNYTCYYGYRNPRQEADLRLRIFAERQELFQDKDILDIGCNIGHITLCVARDFGARSIVGLDIDRKLVEIARKNVKHYVNCIESPAYESLNPGSKLFPISMPILYGPVDIPCFSKEESPFGGKKFPHNITFIHGNYVLENDVLLSTETPQFDVILCLSVTKWMHLNWGDNGLKKAFKRMFNQLRPGGKLILEAQAWDSYKRKKNLTETIYNNYNSIELFPQKFTQYLLSSEVGFSKCEVLGTPLHHAPNFQRPIKMFSKSEISPSYSTGSDLNIQKIPVYASVVDNSTTPAHISTPGSNEEVAEQSTKVEES